MLTLLHMTVAGRPILLFDGECNLCSAAVQFVLNRERDEGLRFASLQSAPGAALLERIGRSNATLDTVVLVDDRGVHFRSDAVLRVARRLRGWWPLLYAGIVIPRALRDWLYDWVARRRVAWFGRREQCLAPTPDLASRFLDAPPTSRVVPP